MYFKEKEDTNIDKEFEKEKKINLDFKKLKPILLITGGIILIAIIIFVIIALLNNSDKYTLELLGEENITINLGENYVEPGYKAYDKKDNDVTAEVKVLNEIDTSKIGKYEILYTIGNVNKVRYITVIEALEETYIYLKGTANMYLEIGEKYKEPGYQVYDSIDQDLTEKVKVSGTVNSNKIGTYQITYSVVNSRNITTTVKRTVIVVEKGKKPKN